MSLDLKNLLLAFLNGITYFFFLSGSDSQHHLFYITIFQIFLKICPAKTKMQIIHSQQYTRIIKKKLSAKSNH